MNESAPIAARSDRAIGSFSADRRWIAVAIVTPLENPSTTPQSVTAAA